MKKGIRVYYAQSGTGRIDSGIAVSTNTKIVRFDDGGWNPVEDCYLTKRQCERANGLLPRKTKRVIVNARGALSNANRAIETALNRLQLDADS